MTLYIGDGVYVSDDGWQLWLAADHHDNKVIALEPATFMPLIECMARMINKQTFIEALRALANRLEDQL